MRFNEFKVNEEGGPINSLMQFVKTLRQPTTAPNAAPATTTGHSVMPVNGRITTQFGAATPLGSHPGVDIAVPVGTSVASPEAGIVSKVGNDRTAGLYVNLSTTTGKLSNRFLHLSKINVQQGQQVSAGQSIGLSGTTGFSTGPHLHWEKYVNGQPVDPLK